MAIQIISATHRGLDGVLINVEVDITRGIPIFNIVGLSFAYFKVIDKYIELLCENNNLHLSKSIIK